MLDRLKRPRPALWRRSNLIRFFRDLGNAFALIRPTVTGETPFERIPEVARYLVAAVWRLVRAEPAVTVALVIWALLDAANLDVRLLDRNLEVDPVVAAGFVIRFFVYAPETINQSDYEFTDPAGADDYRDHGDLHPEGP